MERKIGDTFEHEGKQLKVVENKCGLCDGCFFMQTCNVSLDEKLGFCEPDSRSDNKKVIFVEVQPQQTEKPKELNLCELLRHCPKDEQFWSPMLGDVIFYGINQSEGIVRVEMENGEILGINSDGTITICGITSREIMLYPSREQRDWSKFKQKKEKFDPKTLQPYDKVLVRNSHSSLWQCNFFFNIRINESVYSYNSTAFYYAYCIPCNNETKHLAGTTEEAPEYYRYWED